jgi:uncharacterized protein YprB with RNaseH-like and TPR domain
MDLKDKLKYYQTEKKQIEPESELQLEEMASILKGSILEKNTLPIIKIERTIPCHFIIPRINEKRQSSIHIPLLTKKQFPDPFGVNDVLVFDLETTGLAGGTGTYPFLIGFGEFKDSFFRIFQYFLPDFGREISAYLEISKIVKEKKILLSYNGKSFDYPLIRNRFILNRIENPFESYTHLDLLHSTRRLYRNNLPSCSLESIEQHIFSFHRLGDIDGSQIPQTYFSFVQTGELSDIQRIIDHNQQDIISLARLLFHIHYIENNAMNTFHSEKDFISLFNMAVKISDMERITPMIDSLASNDKKLPGKSLKSYSLMLKKQKNWTEALKIWQKLIDQGEEILFSCEEIAKFYEHHKKSFDHAIDYTNRAIEYINIVDDINHADRSMEYLDRFNIRLNRLHKKRLKQRNSS